MIYAIKTGPNEGNWTSTDKLVAKELAALNKELDAFPCAAFVEGSKHWTRICAINARMDELGVPQ